ncbi:MAG: hypothetical protein QOE41_1482 [Mycobacterium sp.]|jgi:hypothetical protein|nr:hypothetical protein [Mycobacterium sp.]MDT5132171.1 hypothetical protein [Mycobacterium sp.]
MSTRRPTKHDAAQATPSYTRAEFTAWLAASCERQGVPLIVTDPTVIAHVATVLGYIGPVPHRARRRRETETLDTPDRLGRLMSRRWAPGTPGAMTA